MNTKHASTVKLPTTRRNKKPVLMSESSPAARAADVEQSDREYAAKKMLDTLAADFVDSVLDNLTTGESAVVKFIDMNEINKVTDNDSLKEHTTMAVLTLKKLDKRERYGIYTGSAVSIRLPLGAFPNKTAPETVEFAGLLGPREKKAPLTAEERKAARAAKPKLTNAEKLAKREAALEKLRAKVAAEAAQPSA
jgi:hypothetical protein